MWRQDRRTFTLPQNVEVTCTGEQRIPVQDEWFLNSSCQPKNGLQCPRISTEAGSQQNCGRVLHEF